MKSSRAFAFILVGAHAWFGIEADLATYGKIVGGGMPIGVVAGRSKYMDGLDGGMWHYGDASYPQAKTTFFAGTFCKHPLAMAAAYASLKHMKAHGPALQEQLNQRTSWLAQTLNAYFAQEQVPIQVAHFGSLFYFMFKRNMDLLFYHMLEKGIHVWEGRTNFLSTAHTDEDITRIIQVVQESIEALREGGFLPERPINPPPSGSPPSSPSEPDRNGKRPTHISPSPSTLRPFGPSASSTPLTPLTPLTIKGTPREIEHVTVAKEVPLTEAQKQLWLLAQIGDEGSLAYRVSTTLELRGPFHLAAMRQAVQKLIKRHEALRTTISRAGDVQYVWPALSIDVPLIDLENENQNVAADDREGALTAWFRTESQQVFNLTEGPLVRVKILKLEAQRHLLAFCGSSHHRRWLVDGYHPARASRTLFG